MLILFLRAVLLYFLVFAVIRLTGKRQVADLQPFDLLITLMIADLASCAIADTSIPLAYSVVPIIALFLAQRGVTYACLKSARVRRLFAGNPLILVRDGVLQEEAMAAANYSVDDLLDQMRSKGTFSLSDVAFAILETNGSMSVLQKSGTQTPTRDDFNLPLKREGLAYLLILDGELCKKAMATRGVDEAWVMERLALMRIKKREDVFFLELTADGLLRAQTRARLGAEVKSLQTEVTIDAV